MVEQVKGLDDEEFQIFLNELGIDEPKPTEEVAKAEDAKTDAEVLSKTEEVQSDIAADKESEASDEEPNYEKTDSDEAELKEAINEDTKADSAVQTAQDAQQTESAGEALEQGQPENSIAPQEQEPQIEASPETTPEKGEQPAQAETVTESETIAALVARIGSLEEKIAILAEQKAEVPAYGGISRQSVLSDSDIGSTQDGKPRTLEEWRRKYAYLDNK